MPAYPDITRPSTLRFGVMCNGTVFQRWQADALTGLLRHGHQPVLLIVDGAKRPAVSPVKRILRKKWANLLFSTLENRLFLPDAKRPVDMHRDLAKVASLVCITERRGFSEYFQPEDIHAIRGYDLDFILRFGFGIIRGEILKSARFGVWSFHHGDEQKYRGGPAGFWEIVHNDPVNGAILQQLTEKLDAGVVLRKGYLKTVMHSYRENLEQLLSMSSSWPAEVADALSCGINPGRHGHAQPEQPAAPLYKVPGNFRMLKFLFLLLRNRVKFHYRDLLATEQWNIGIIRKPLHDVALSGKKLQTGDIEWFVPLNEPGYIADPAGFFVEGRLHILAEKYSYRTRQAVIAGINRESEQSPSTVIDHGKHLSYPFAFEHNGEIYCVPESCLDNAVALYRRDAATGTFLKVRTLLTGVGAVDPTLFQYRGRWWLFFTAAKWSCTHLFIYHAGDLASEFLPHRGNPVIMDIRSARPAGTPFIFENVLYRPAQDCSVTYGGRVAVNRVVRLTPDEFVEETVCHVEPDAGGRYNAGLHTLSGVGDLTLVDGKRYMFDRRFFIGRLREKLTGKGVAHV